MIVASEESVVISTAVDGFDRTANLHVLGLPALIQVSFAVWAIGFLRIAAIDFE
jgi:hypothetical protein